MKSVHAAMLIIVLVLSGNIYTVSAQEAVNAGIVSGIWYSQEPFFAGDNVRIYAAIQNQSGFDLKGVVVFYDNGAEVGEAQFSAINGRLIEVWSDWVPIEGDHRITASLADLLRSTAGEPDAPVVALSDAKPKDERFVDVDSDADDIGDKDDVDDDNDGLSDKEEAKLGTNPVEEDTDDDGVSDGKEKAQGSDPLDPKSKTNPAEELEEISHTQDTATSSQLGAIAEDIVTVIATSNKAIESTSEKVIITIDEFMQLGAEALVAEREEYRGAYSQETQVVSGESETGVLYLEERPFTHVLYGWLLTAGILSLRNWLYLSLILLLYIAWRLAKKLYRTLIRPKGHKDYDD